MKVKLSLFLFLILIMAATVGCGNKAAVVESNDLEAFYVSTEKEAPIVADPEGAVGAVYQQVEQMQGSYDAKELNMNSFEDLTGITADEALEVIAYQSNPKSILSDVFVVKPYPSLREDVRAKLINYREGRVREFENFDIFDAHTIAKNAVVYDQGEYLVLLMLTDNQSAQQQVDQYIPQ